MEKKHHSIIKIAIIGAESTGKTTLCSELSNYFKATWMPEYARGYVENLTRPYTWNDVLHIASKQIKMERDYEKKSGHILFLDTDLVITRVWLEHLWNKCPQWINNSIATSQRLIYLICDNDLPWEYDPVRENPDIRDDLLERYKSIIIQNNFPYFVVTGKGKARTANAIKKLNELI